MRAANSRQGMSRKGKRIAWLSMYAALAAASLLVVRAAAGQESAVTNTKGETISGSAAHIAPNYALEERFLPDRLNKLVFDLAVTPHWFSESDRFWYSFQTTEGTRYYLVDPVKKSKTP